MLLRALRPVAIVLYLVLAALLLAIWFPRFVVMNVAIKPTATWTYIAATGLPLAALAVSALARQMAEWRLSWSLLVIVGLGWFTGRLASYVFQSPEQAPTVCALHLLICFVGTLWNLWRYRKTVQELDKERQKEIERRQAELAARLSPAAAPVPTAAAPAITTDTPAYAAGSLPVNTPVVPVVGSVGSRPYATATAVPDAAHPLHPVPAAPGSASVPLTVAPPPLTRSY